ncbi:MAG: hypothetical protein KJ063_13145 [Anaerolineae bacterium]|nr:hypothetical protein [Anaerolineae bacterium]
MSDALEYTVYTFETRTYVDRYAYWVDWRPTPIPTPLTSTPGANDSDEAIPEGPLAYCARPAENTGSLRFCGVRLKVGGYPCGCPRLVRHKTGPYIWCQPPESLKS